MEPLNSIYSRLLNSKLKQSYTLDYWVYDVEPVYSDQQYYFKVFIFNRTFNDKQPRSISFKINSGSNDKVYTAKQFSTVSLYNDKNIFGCIIKLDEDLHSLKNDLVITEYTNDDNLSIKGNEYITIDKIPNANPKQESYLSSIDSQLRVMPCKTDEYWICSCGYLNTNTLSTCARCNIPELLISKLIENPDNEIFKNFIESKVLGFDFTKPFQWNIDSFLLPLMGIVDLDKVDYSSFLETNSIRFENELKSLIDNYKANNPLILGPLRKLESILTEYASSAKVSSYELMFNKNELDGFAKELKHNKKSAKKKTTLTLVIVTALVIVLGVSATTMMQMASTKKILDIKTAIMEACNLPTASMTLTPVSVIANKTTFNCTDIETLYLNPLETNKFLVSSESFEANLVSYLIKNDLDNDFNKLKTVLNLKMTDLDGSSLLYWAVFKELTTKMNDNIFVDYVKFKDAYDKLIRTGVIPGDYSPPNVVYYMEDYFKMSGKMISHDVWALIDEPKTTLAEYYEYYDNVLTLELFALNPQIMDFKKYFLEYLIQGTITADTEHKEWFVVEVISGGFVDSGIASAKTAGQILNAGIINDKSYTVNTALRQNVQYGTDWELDNLKFIKLVVGNLKSYINIIDQYNMTVLDDFVERRWDYRTETSTQSMYHYLKNNGAICNRKCSLEKGFK